MVGYFLVFMSLICVSLQQDIPDISTDETLTRWYLWTRQNPTENQEIFYDNLTSIEQSNFDSSKKTIVLVHGYNGNGKQGWAISMKNAYLQKGMKGIYVIIYESFLNASQDFFSLRGLQCDFC